MDILLCYANFNTILKQSQFILKYLGVDDNNNVKKNNISIFKLENKRCK